MKLVKANQKPVCLERDEKSLGTLPLPLRLLSLSAAIAAVAADSRATLEIGESADVDRD